MYQPPLNQTPKEKHLAVSVTGISLIYMDWKLPFIKLTLNHL